jgi:hypothetical protein
MSSTKPGLISWAILFLMKYWTLPATAYASLHHGVSPPHLSSPEVRWQVARYQVLRRLDSRCYTSRLKERNVMSSFARLGNDER